MTCEEFATAGLDLGTAMLDGPVQKEAQQHLLSCPHCAALHENWQTLQGDLRDLGAETLEAQASPELEQRLRREFSATQASSRSRRTALWSAWALGAAAALFLILAWFHGQGKRSTDMARLDKRAGPAISQASSRPTVQTVPPGGPELGEQVVATNDSNEFTLLPGSVPPSLEDATVVCVEMQRGALSDLGLTVDEEHASDVIQVDLLVGEDGLPQAVRLSQSAE